MFDLTHSYLYRATLLDGTEHDDTLTSDRAMTVQDIHDTVGMMYGAWIDKIEILESVTTKN